MTLISTIDSGFICKFEYKCTLTKDRKNVFTNDLLLYPKITGISSTKKFIVKAPPTSVNYHLVTAIAKAVGLGELHNKETLATSYSNWQDNTSCSCFSTFPDPSPVSVEVIMNGALADQIVVAFDAYSKGKLNWHTQSPPEWSKFIAALTLIKKKEKEEIEANARSTSSPKAIEDIIIRLLKELSFADSELFTEAKMTPLMEIVSNGLEESNAFEAFADMMSSQNLKHRIDLVDKFKKMFLEYKTINNPNFFRSKISDLITIWKEDHLGIKKKDEVVESKENEKLSLLHGQNVHLMEMQELQKKNSAPAANGNNSNALAQSVMKGIASNAMSSIHIPISF